MNTMRIFFFHFVLTFARDSAVDKLTPDSSPSFIRGFDCSPPLTKNMILLY
jgi:hypothetical protein